MSVRRLVLMGLLCTALAAGLAQAPGRAAKENGMSKQWVVRRNQDAQLLLDVTTRFSPERASALGIANGDTRVADLDLGD